MSQIYSALAYYWDHKQEVDADMKQREKYAKRLQKEAGESPFFQTLRFQKLIKRVYFYIWFYSQILNLSTKLHIQNYSTPFSQILFLKNYLTNQ